MDLDTIPSIKLVQVRNYRLPVRDSGQDTGHILWIQEILEKTTLNAEKSSSQFLLILKDWPESILKYHTDFHGPSCHLLLILICHLISKSIKGL